MSRLDVYNQFVAEARELVHEASSVCELETANRILLRVRSVRALLDYVEAESLVAARTLSGGWTNGPRDEVLERAIGESRELMRQNEHLRQELAKRDKIG